MTKAPAIDRRHHTGLQSLRTRSDSPYTPRRGSRQGSLTSLNSTPPLPSPTIVAARAFYLENVTSMGDTADSQKRKGLIEVQRFPRRHSVLATTNSLEVQLENFSFKKGSRDLPTVPEADEVAAKVKEEVEEDDVSMPDIEANDTSEDLIRPRGSSSAACRKSQHVLRQVPFQYTHDHLRDWGYAYLGNPATADAFINPVSLRRPSLAVAMGDGLEVKPATELTTIRARVVPRGKDRKPFLIQRQFDIKELQGSIPQVPASGTKSSSSSPAPPSLRRSSRARRSSAQHTTTTLSPSTPAPPKSRSPSLSKGALPMHIEYALHYLPVLGALMLSGHVRKGDSIDLPIPHPGAWREVLTYIYTGRGDLTPAVRENILFLAGHA
ncbi:hypothetical protein LZ554_008166 [Drepanopeziza brunnea f. sp. 'monogermtubi']|nr:hypothetical protein LZ554_008166 [Drepanopeziza brunnea f. sp. 'monogermtubi']